MVVVSGNVGSVNKRTFNGKNGETSVLDISVAENVRDPKAENGRRTNWYRTAIFGKYADTMQQYIQKGTILQVSGDLRVDEYTTKDGRNGVSLNIENPVINLLGGGNRKGEDSNNSAPAPATQAIDEGFVNVPEGISEELPFA